MNESNIDKPVHDRATADRQLQQRVLEELDFEPRIDSAHIGVSVTDGVVTLSGHVPGFTQTIEAERAAWRVKGVKALVMKLDVHLPFDPVTDEELARRARGLLTWSSTVPDSVRLRVSNGRITLIGEVPWQYQRINAERSIQSLKGLKGITNEIVVKPTVQPSAVKDQITQALKRNAEVEARQIRVEVRDGGNVTLEGTVDSWIERKAAENAAWAVPGVTAVQDRLGIG
ncbi:BON domain-containing protein [Cognatilysobacter lacus]|uniref:BON domain-containing protein n=1 Tax=Cognatilysobacter lacus TaxID=1643323 RepID=A0A5D8Z668_9GAMM|nr:BON domain-containing protein [Lysobacter lacus]TZF90016.1 BON domain-containing protein [Lysobacter lacus]